MLRSNQPLGTTPVERLATVNEAKNVIWRCLLGLVLAAGLAVLTSCTGMDTQKMMEDGQKPYVAGTIIAGQSGQTVSFETLLKDLTQVRVIYVGESHTDPEHHAVQLQVIKALHGKNPKLMVGMEMFDRTYQPVLTQWSAGKLDSSAFIKKSHWYANWKYDFELYRPIFEFIQAKHLPLVALNIPAHIQSRIAVGGLESLSTDDRRQLPDQIDKTQKEHRAYLEKVFGHHKIRGMDNFEYFYSAQCVWEDTMAETIARYTPANQMVILAGNGHIQFKYGIPIRAYARNAAPFRTIYLATVGDLPELDIADYIWITPPRH